MPSQSKRKSTTKQDSAPAESSPKKSRTPSKTSPAKVTPKEESPKKSRLNTVSDSFLARLVTTKCSELKLPNLFTVKKEDKVSDVWGKLIEKMIMAAPVVDNHGNFQGFIDTSDIASYLVAKFGEPMLRSNLGTEVLNEAMTKELRIWMNKSVGDVMAFDYPTKLHCPPVCYANYSLMSAFEPLAMMAGLHRVAVVESPTSNRLVTVITQSQALEFVHENVNRLGSRKSKPIEECVDVLKPEGIFVVTKDHIALDAFQHMLRHGVSALAVVSEPKGQTKGVIALRDLQVIGNDGADLWKLYLGVETFLKFKTLARVVTVVEHELNKAGEKVKEEVGDTAMASETAESKTAEPEAPTSHKASKKADILPVVTSNVLCKKGDTFASAIKKLTQFGVRRLFVTDEDSIPFGVVSIKEVLKEIMH